MATLRQDGRVTALQRLGCAGLAGGRAESQPDGAQELLDGAGAGGTSSCPSGMTNVIEEGILNYRLVTLFMDELGHISHWRAIMAERLAGMVATIVTYLTDVIKTRLIMQNQLEPSYKGIYHTFYKIYHQEGLCILPWCFTSNIRTMQVSGAAYRLARSLIRIQEYSLVPFRFGGSEPQAGMWQLA
ncbi:hypothetical protein HGM15179_018944 [Zosterops borbonicus]|uniref:Uncharacterized protein n=1 Tax=Zosterops borbonicus TaxID=364589 RepID=A0A8K1D9L9_9PASS|nr:hypothetical protein HGM15179_018944 [Zosterops borbonicus]